MYTDDATVTAPLAKIQQTSEAWTLDLNVNSPSLILSCLTVNNRMVKISGHFLKDGNWKEFSETHVIPDGYSAVSNSNVNGNMKIIARKFVENDYSGILSNVTTMISQTVESGTEAMSGSAKVQHETLRTVVDSIGNSIFSEGLKVGNIQMAPQGITVGNMEMSGHGINIWEIETDGQSSGSTTPEVEPQGNDRGSSEIPSQEVGSGSHIPPVSSSHHRKRRSWPFPMNFKWPWEWPFQ